MDAKIGVQANVVADLDRRLAQIDGAIEKATSNVLHVDPAKIDGARRKAEADLGQIKDLATLLGARDDDVLRWFVLVVAMPLDPAAVLLLAAATRRNECPA